MIVKLNTRTLRTLEQVRAFLAGTASVSFEAPAESGRYAWIVGILRQFGYARLKRRDKGLLRRLLLKVSGYSRAQLNRLIAQWCKTRTLADRRGPPARPFVTRYTEEDIRLLVEFDELHATLSGPATKKLAERAYTVFGQGQYARLAGISVAHLYNLRHAQGYQRRRGTVVKTRSVSLPIGERRKPQPNGKPGYLRVDSVHQGDWNGIKGLYLINAVDELTQFQVVLAVERISEHFLIPALHSLIEAFPFSILGFHSDNGSEYINRQVASMLEKLRIEFTKSRARRTNDNALVESKNGSVVRKHLGYAHIPGRFAQDVGAYTLKELTPYLNYHRPCFFPETITNDKGRQTKRYPYARMMTPYDKLKSLPNAQCYLKPGLSFAILDLQAYAVSDNAAAASLNEQRRKLFARIHSQPRAA